MRFFRSHWLVKKLARLGPQIGLAAPSEGGQVLVLMAMAVAATEVAVGLSILIALFRHIRSVDVDAPRASALRD